MTILDRCKGSDRDATHMLMATDQALGHNMDDLVINRLSNHRVRGNFWKLQVK